MIESVMNSPADLAIIPVQDLLGLSTEARMNLPGVATGNWEWRMTGGQLTPGILERLRKLTLATDRAQGM
jgi:4-alpha-glucanotransferase